MDKGAWRDAVQGVAKSQAQQSNWAYKNDDAGIVAEENWETLASPIKCDWPLASNWIHLYLNHPAEAAFSSNKPVLLAKVSEATSKSQMECRVQEVVPNGQHQCYPNCRSHAKLARQSPSWFDEYFSWCVKAWGPLFWCRGKYVYKILHISRGYGFRVWECLFTNSLFPCTEILGLLGEKWIIPLYMTVGRPTLCECHFCEIFPVEIPWKIFHFWLLTEKVIAGKWFAMWI